MQHEKELKKSIFLICAISILIATAALGFFYSEETSSKKSPSGPISPTGQGELASSAAIDEKINILFVGDMMFDRWIRQTSQDKNTDFSLQKIHELLQKQDLVVGNLEGPITDSPSVSIGSAFGSKENYIFTFPPETAQKLYGENIRLVNLGNNHILNFQESGLDATKKYLTEARINFFGDTGKSGQRFFIQNVKGMQIAFVNYNQFAASGKQNAMDDLQAVKKTQPDLIVVYTHWGTEFADTPNGKDRELAHRFIDAGADILIGSHPHVIQTKEIYRGKSIYYSLGNFIFDQYFDRRTQTGLAVQLRINISDKKMSAQEYSVTMKTNGQTALE